MQHTSYSQLSEKDKTLLDTAEAMMQKAYAPYSNFTVGAALLLENSHIIGGTNVENAAYGQSLCAERAAIVAANAQGYRRFQAIAIIGKLAKQQHSSDEVTSPCGSCRQVLFEMAQLAKTDIKVICANSTKERVLISSAYDLLPLGFGPNNITTAST